MAERWVDSCRREILDHVIALNEQYLRRLVRDYVSYHHQDRIHSLEKDTPSGLAGLLQAWGLLYAPGCPAQLDSRHIDPVGVLRAEPTPPVVV